MLTKVRDNIFIGDSKVKVAELSEAGVTVVLSVTREKVNVPDNAILFHVDLYSDKINRPHVKDIACHIPKYMIQNGEVVAIIGTTGKIRAAYVAARAICELENCGIYEVLLDFQTKIKGFEIGRSYL